MTTAALQDAFTALFTSTSRLYRLEAEQGDQETSQAAGLMVESWSLRESLSQPWELQLSTLSTRADIDIDALLGQRITLFTRLADGHTEHPRSGLISDVTTVDSDGGFARYTVTVRPWLILLAYGARSAVWQEKTVVEIVDSVFGAYYHAHGAWAWRPCALQHLGQSHQAGLRSYTVQYRETDLAFVSRVLAREGLVYRFERDDAAPLGHQLVLLADTTQAASCAEDATSAQSGGVRFHRASSQEQQDTVQVLSGVRQLQAAESHTLVWDYKLKRAVVASVPTVTAYAGPQAPRITRFQPEADYSYADAADAERAMLLAQQALEARHKTWLGRSTVRTFAAGLQFQLTDSPLDLQAALSAEGKDADEQTHFLLTSVVHAGINNLPKALYGSILKTLREPGVPGQAEDATDDATDDPSLLPPLASWVSEEVRTRASLNGYGNSFEAIRSYVPWRVALFDERGARYPTPRPGGPLLATVVGPDGATSGTGAQEIHTDRLGRIRIRFDFQAPEAQTASTPSTQSPQTSNSSSWVRVMQRFAGPGMGWQFTPRLGQEVLVDFMDGRIDRPIVIATFYNGQGEAGRRPTPGGEGSANDTSSLASSHDHRPGAQGNLIGTGHSPAWHGAGALAASPGAAGQSNPSALNGIKTKEFGAWGYNQLVLDDSPGQLRVQLATSQYATQLNLGHLLHQADNHRGSLRGAGFELRTDAYGAIRAASGVLITTYGTTGTGGSGTGDATREPAGDNAAGIALAAQLLNLGQSMHRATQIHQTTGLAAAQVPPGANESPLQAWHTSLKGMVNAASFDAAKADAAQHNTSTSTGNGNGNVPASSTPLIALQARAGWATTAGQDVQLSAAHNITLASGQDNTWATGGAYRIHTGQSIGLLAGAVQPGTEAAGTGITLIAAQGDTQIQAQSNTLQIAAQQQLSIQSETAHIDWAAAKKITLATAGGASIVIEGGNITFMCPGTITVKAGAKQFEAPERVSYALPRMPKTSMQFMRDFPFSI